MRVLAAGATGAIGTPLLELLRAAGVSVVGMTRSEAGAERIRSLGAEPAIADALDRDAVARVVADAQPDAIVHQLTAIPPAINPRRAPRQFAQTNRLRTEGTRNLVDAAAGAKLIAQSIAFMYEPEGDAVKGEDAPLRRSPVSSFRPQIDALVELERTVGAAGGVVLRYGYFYGPGTSYARDGSIADMVRKRRFPIVGEGGGIFSFVHVRDAAEATVAALDARGRLAARLRERARCPRAPPGAGVDGQGLRRRVRGGAHDPAARGVEPAREGDARLEARPPVVARGLRRGPRVIHAFVGIPTALP